MTEYEAATRLHRWHMQAWRWCLLGGTCVGIPLGWLYQGGCIGLVVICILIARFVLGSRIQGSAEAEIVSRAAIQRHLGPRVSLDAVRKPREC